jgi:hypothetical protein
MSFHHVGSATLTATASLKMRSISRGEVTTVKSAGAAKVVLDVNRAVLLGSPIRHQWRSSNWPSFVRSGAASICANAAMPTRLNRK